MENTYEKKPNTIAYKIIIIVLTLAIIFLLWEKFNSNSVNKAIVEKKTQNNELLQAELDSLLAEHERIKLEYGDLSGKLASKDSLILAQAEEIQKILTSKNASAYDLRRAQKKLNGLRTITQDYVTKMDSLYSVNRELRDENYKIKDDLVFEQEKTSKLSDEKESLSKKVEYASSLKAYNISSGAFRLKSGGSKEKPTDKAKKADRIKVCFTLGQNLLAKAGNKTVYVRIARPDNLILCKGTEDIYSFNYNGEKLQYSMKAAINYQNSEQKVCLNWEKRDRQESAMKGVYTIAIFCDGQEIGITHFSLK